MLKNRFIYINPKSLRIDVTSQNDSGFDDTFSCIGNLYMYNLEDA